MRAELTHIGLDVRIDMEPHHTLTVMCVLTPITPPQLPVIMCLCREKIDLLFVNLVFLTGLGRATNFQNLRPIHIKRKRRRRQNQKFSLFEIFSRFTVFSLYTNPGHVMY